MFEDLISYKENLKSDTSTCPYCKTNSTSIIHIQVVNHMIHERTILCNNCYKQWIVVYNKYSVVSIITKEKEMVGGVKT